MLIEPRGSDYVIWLVALALYAWDSAHLLSPRELLLVEAGRQRLSVVFSESPFTIMGRVLSFSPLLFPHRGVFVARNLTPRRAGASAVADARRISLRVRLTGFLESIISSSDRWPRSRRTRWPTPSRPR